MSSDKEQTSVKSCCITGHIHEGTPEGSFQELYGIRTYVSNKKSGGEKQDVCLLISDVFGADFVNTQLVADEWARRGWKVILPDFFQGDPIDVSNIQAIMPNIRHKAKASLVQKSGETVQATSVYAPWLFRHRESVSRPLVEQFVKDLRNDPTTGKVAAIGYCWGARYCMLLAQDTSPVKVDVAIGNHPSFLTQDDVKPITSIPCAIFKGDVDDIMSDSQLEAIEEILRPKLGDNLFVKLYPDAVHGFAVRGDMEDGREKAQKEDVNKIAMDFVAKHFAA
ncbi:hypothetical protein CI109_103919 [Kwoniella shandongensis]|uniref:Dienelactone hydrolase domain-containing protein n=1 Tax=Kwoniella shandongensis TaxID=1734106 RepID=A0A5M6BUY4_9TREE|nr:uncharacterized protein CI109_005627 [Kwoniella shandongensis]KAA5526031.1 hypothetical protein CI109_005627 [Kwoniella shandongensis]